MRNFKLSIGRSELQSQTYSISRSSSAYSFFRYEFHSLPEDPRGNLLIPPSSTVLDFKNSFLTSLKRRLFRKDEAIVIPLGSKEHMYFASEYQQSMGEDRFQNIIVPAEEYPEVKTKKR